MDEAASAVINGAQTWTTHQIIQVAKQQMEMMVNMDGIFLCEYLLDQSLRNDTNVWMTRM